MNKDAKIIIVGAGCFGNSTAYHLSQRGYTSIRVFDRYPPPSCDAASTDISKVIRSDYNDPLYARLAADSIVAWQTWTIFRKTFHQSGWILSADTKSRPIVEGSIRVGKELGVRGIEQLLPTQIQSRFPVVNGDMQGWDINVWNPAAGWVVADKAMERIVRESQAYGAQYISGDRNGYVRELILEDGRCRGVITADGVSHMADVVILSAGAWSPSLFDTQGQLTARGHSVAHIQLQPDEVDRYAPLPILNNLDLGYFFPPTSDGTFKMVHTQLITNTKTNKVSRITTSIPHTFVESPGDDLPVEIEAQMRRNLQGVFPDLARRPFSHTRICWDAETSNRHFVVAPCPTSRGLFLATGGSAHAFKFLPVLGQYVADMVEGRLDSDIAHQWQWPTGESLQVNPEFELQHLTGWKGGKKRERTTSHL